MFFKKYFPTDAVKAIGDHPVGNDEAECHRIAEQVAIHS
jgi:hypothetical protein